MYPLLFDALNLAIYRCQLPRNVFEGRIKDALE